VLGQLGEGHVALVGAVEERRDRRGLEQNTRLDIGVDALVLEGPHMHRGDEAFVDRHGRNARERPA
jgi:hypothetical protein